DVDPTGVVIKRTYDAKDHLLTETFVVGLDDATSGEHDDLTTTYHYDADGNRIETIDPRGNSTRMTYSQYGEPLTTTDALGNTVEYQYDERGSIKRMTDPSGNVTNLAYDADGNLNPATNAAGTAIRAA